MIIYVYIYYLYIYCTHNSYVARVLSTPTKNTWAHLGRTSPKDDGKGKGNHQESLGFSMMKLAFLDIPYGFTPR